MSEQLSEQAERVLSLLSTKFRFEMRKAVEVDGKRFRVLGKVAQTKALTEGWVLGTTYMLRELPKLGVQLDLSKFYFLQDEEQRWAWRLIFSSDTLAIADMYNAIATSLSSFSTKPYIPVDGLVANMDGFPVRGVVGRVGEPNLLKQPTKFGTQVRMGGGGGGNG